MPWYSSWLPGVPSLKFSLPSGLQERFISFVLKKSLGHLLKPGQLNFHQIDSQLGSGYVQIHNVELNNEAIDALISDLPLTLNAGSMSSVIARIPWPNPLTSTLGFSLDSLHLTFHLTPPSNVSNTDPNITESMASVAESFVYEELTPREGVALGDSFHLPPSTPSDTLLNLPGGLDVDPFLFTPEDESSHSEVDPAGVSVFATLIERLLARFEFDAVNTKITLVHPGNMSLTVSISDIRYRTEPGDVAQRGTSNEGDFVSGGSRTISITGVTVAARDLQSSNPHIRPTTIDTLSPNSRNAHSVLGSLGTLASPGTPSSSPQSSLSTPSPSDEETPFSMTQSLAFLPPRLVSPANSACSDVSMYQSAISTRPSFVETSHYQGSDGERTPSPMLPTPPSMEPSRRSVNEVIVLSFGLSPILISLTTSRPSDTLPTPSFPHPLPIPPTGILGSESLCLAITCGVIACAFTGRHIRGISNLLDDWTSPHFVGASAQPKPPNSSSPVTTGLTFAATLRVRDIVFLTLLPNVEASSDSSYNTSAKEFFERPLVPPMLTRGYFRISLESISVSVTLLPPPHDADPPSDESQEQGETTKNALSVAPQLLLLRLGVGDISVFSFAPTSKNEDSKLILSPILITDHDLPTQYTSSHRHPNQTAEDSEPSRLPTIEIVEWTDEKHQHHGIKLSPWRNKTNRKKANAGPSGTDFSTTFSAENITRTAGDQLNLPSSVMTITAKQPLYAQHPQQHRMGGELEVQVAPIHIFVNLEQATRSDGILAFLNEAVDNDPNIIHDQRSGAHFQGHADPGCEFFHASSQAARSRREGETYQPEFKASVQFDLIRLQTRCPPPPGRLPRSGSLLLDVHDVIIKNRTKTSAPGARFYDPTNFMPREHNEIPLIDIDLARFLIACSPVHNATAISFLSLGPLDTISSALRPRLALTRAKPSTKESPTVMYMKIDLPSAHIDMSKQVFDALQFWIDDVTNLVENASGGIDEGGVENADSRDTSLIGSRFFAKPRSGGGSMHNVTQRDEGKMMLKISISEAFIRIMIPRAKNGPMARPFIFSASDVDVAVNIKPGGRDETVVALSVMSLTVQDIIKPNESQMLLSMTSRRGLASGTTSMIKLRFTSLVVPESTGKESRIHLTLSNFTYTIFPDFSWISDLASFLKSPPGTFESVIPSERTHISLKALDGSIRVFAPSHPGAILMHVGDLNFSTDVVGESPDSSFRFLASALSLLFVDDISDLDADVGEAVSPRQGVAFWKGAGFALLAEIADLKMIFKNTHTINSAVANVIIDQLALQIHLCADSLTAVIAFSSDLNSVFNAPKERVSKVKMGPTMVSQTAPSSLSVMASVDDLTFKKLPEVGPAPDMISDDLPTNLDYLDESFGAAAGLRELRDDDVDEFNTEDTFQRRTPTTSASNTGIISMVGGETIKILRPEGVRVEESHFNNLPPEAEGASVESSEAVFRLRAHNTNVTLFLYEGYDWAKTRKTIEEEVKDMRRRLAKIRQLVATGQTQDSSIEETSTLLFNSLYIGLDQDIDELEPGALIAAIDEELKDDVDVASESSWQTLRSPAPNKTRNHSVRVHGKRLTRSKGASMEFRLIGVKAELDRYRPDEAMVARVLATVNDLEILDHIKTSTWKKFLTELRSDAHGNIRETDSNMVRVELRTVRPVPNHPSEEARLRAKILPLRLYVDQDAVDFLKKFFSFKGTSSQTPDTDDTNDETYFQLAEVFPVNLKLDYKPRRVDYRALREGKTIELMNFFHFDGAEMTLRHITLAGITGWSRFFELLNDLWTPDVKATQLVEVISGVAPIRSVVNVGSGIADLVLLPIAQYKKDGRIVRGVQKGTTAFVKSTAIEAVKLGARLATGTQVILEQAEDILGGQFTHPITAETVQGLISEDDFTQCVFDGSDEDESDDVISKYAQQPIDIKEGVQSAYKSLQRNFNSAAQTILAVPMEVYERSGNEGPVRSVIRAVPIAVLKPMIGASEAVSKTLLGLHNSLDPNVRHENEAKYKRR